MNGKNRDFEKTFLDFKNWVESIQTAGYNGMRTVFTFDHFPKIMNTSSRYEIHNGLMSYSPIITLDKIFVYDFFVL